MSRKLTEGEYRVGVSFNPSQNANVEHIKHDIARLIDFVRANGKDERCTVIACERLEDAAMWAVKTITKEPRYVG